MPDLVKMRVDLARDPAVGARRYTGLHPHPLTLEKLRQRVRIVIFVHHSHIFRTEVGHEAQSMCATRVGIRRNKDSQRHTMGIHGQMYLGIAPPFVRPMASLPPTDKSRQSAPMHNIHSTAFMNWRLPLAPLPLSFARGVWFKLFQDTSERSWR